MSLKWGCALSAAVLTMVFSVAPARAATTVIDLELEKSTAHAVNDSGLMAGTTSVHPGGSRVVKWVQSGRGAIFALPTDATSASGNAINRDGVIAGSAGVAGGSRAFRLELSMLYTMLDPVPGYLHAEGIGIDDFSAVYGRATDPQSGRTAAVRWGSDGVPSVLPVPQGATFVHLTGASSNGYAVGYVNGPDLPYQAVRWNPDGSVTALPRLTDRGATSGYGVNRLGEVVGHAVGPDGASHAARWDGTGTLTWHAPNAVARRINDLGVVVGLGTTGAGSFQPVHWDLQGRMHELGQLDGYISGEPTGINNAGVIAGYVGWRYAPLRAVKWVLG